MTIDELKFHLIEQTTVAGSSPLTLSHPAGDDLIEYSITGNIVQNGTPTPENPIETQGVGDLVTEGEYSGKYKIHVTIADGEQNESTGIYLDTPLMKDEVLYSNGTRDVKWCKRVADIKSTYKAASGNILGISTFTTEQDYGIHRGTVFCNITTNGDSTIVGSCYLNEKNICFVGTSTDTLESLQEKYNGAIVYYQLKTSTTETVAIPNISTTKVETSQLSIDTTVKPTKVSITYNKNETKIIEEVVFHKDGVSTSIDTLEFNGNYTWNKITQIVLKHTAGTFKASAEGDDIKWKYKEQEVTSNSCDFTIDESDNNVYLMFDKELSNFTCINDSHLFLDLSDLNGKITNTLDLSGCTNITRVYSGQSYPTSVYLSNTGLSASDMDSTLINFADSSVSNGTFTANNMTRTSMSDDAVATLTTRGWSVKGLTKVEET